MLLRFVVVVVVGVMLVVVVAGVVVVPGRGGWDELVVFPFVYIYFFVLSYLFVSFSHMLYQRLLLFLKQPVVHK